MRYSCCLHFFLFYLGWNSRMKCVHGGSIVNRTYIETISDSNLDPNGFGANRTGKFLFDSIFRIGSDINTVFDYDDTDDDVDYDAATNVRTCNCDCGQSNQEIRIVGGKPTGVNQFPWMVRLVYDGKFHCGGTLLTKDYVMTAAHCVKRLRRSKIRIILGDHDQYITTETRAIQRAVTSIIKHRRFDPDTYNNDIALLRLRKPVVFSKTIRPICLPRMNYDPAGRIGTVVGWGRTSEGGELPGIVNHVKVPILTINDCRNQKYKSSRITASMLCAGKPSQDSCQGDSGGPLLLSSGYKYHIVGIVSWGVGCGREGYPGVYTRVSKFVPWIKANLEDCGQSNQEIRIVGGKPTGVNQFPWMVRLVYDGKFHCGGTLLTKDYVMTAAHCVKRLRRSKIRIILGDHDQYITTETRAIQRAVTSIIKHRRFDPDTYNNDIALLRLRKPVVFSKTIRPICLPRMNYDPAGRIGTVVGWGRTSEGGELPGIVNHVKVPILTINDCRNQKYKSSRITASMLCAGKPSQDSCQGDSGGPLLLSSGYKYHIVGIVSWGVGCGREGYPGVYTRVSKFVPWIKANLEGTCLCT